MAATDDSLVVVGRMKIASTYEVPSDVWGAANARLIAAAPELLEALVNLHERIADAWPELYNLPPMAAARAAIAKARGEA